MSALIVGVYLTGALFTTALFRLRPPMWFVSMVLGVERDLCFARPDASQQTVNLAMSRTARFGTVVMGVLWPLVVAVIVLDAPGIAWRRYRKR